MRIHRAIALSFVITLVASPAGAQEWPEDEAWVTLFCGDVPSWDPANDEPGAIDERDVVGDDAAPALFVYADDEHVFFRMRVSSDPLMDDELRPFGWGAILDTDGNPRTYQLLLMVDGIREEVVLYRNTAQATLDDPRDPAEVEIIAYDALTHARTLPAEGAFASSFDGTPDFFVDFAVDWVDLLDEGVTENTSARLVMGSSNEANRLSADLACHTGGSGAPTIPAIASDPVNPDGTPAPRPDPDPDPDPDDDGPSLRGGGGVASGCGCEVAGAGRRTRSSFALFGAFFFILALVRRRRARITP